MLVVGRRVIPWILHYIAHTGSRELFRLGVLAIGLGVAYGAAELFDVSFALGAFFAGMVLAESELSHRAAEESLPLRDAFAVLFFVSVGMLFDPAILVEAPLVVAATLAIIIVGKSAAAFLIVKAFRHPAGTSVMIAASLAQIGEFSFILAALGLDWGCCRRRAATSSSPGRSCRSCSTRCCSLPPTILPAQLAPAPRRYARPSPPQRTEQPAGHIVLVGFGRVGSVVGRRSARSGHAASS